MVWYGLVRIIRVRYGDDLFKSIKDKNVKRIKSISLVPEMIPKPEPSFHA